MVVNDKGNRFCLVLLGKATACRAHSFFSRLNRAANPCVHQTGNGPGISCRALSFTSSRLSGQVCKFVGDQAAADWAPFGVWTSWCRSSRSRRSARSLVVNFHLKGLAAVL